MKLAIKKTSMGSEVVSYIYLDKAA